MSLKVINNSEMKNIRRTTLFMNEKKLIKNSQKIVTSQDSRKTSYNIRLGFGLQNIIDNENDDFNESNESQDTIYNENRERQLEILSEKYTKLYNSKEKIYSNIIKEIDIEKHLFYKRSLNSFKLLILKVKCLLKLLKEKFENNLNSKDQRNYYEVDLYIQKIKNEFKKIYFLINEDSKYEYEIITQIYCKFLFIMAIISSKKEEHIRSLSYVSLGVNMLKVFFVRQSIANDIETYKIYAKLIILLINKLLIDNNISQTLIYINVLTRICEIAINIVCKNKLDKKYEYNFNKYNGYGFLFLGYCYELKTNILNNNKISLKAYKEAYYFINKSNNLSFFAEIQGTITVEKKSLFLSQLLYEKLKDKLIFEALEKQKEFEHQERLKKKLIEEEKLREKKYKLKQIASGFIPDPPNIKKIQRRIYNEILTPSNQKLIDKLDDELISYVYKDKPNQNDNEKKEVIKIKINEKKLNTSKKCGKSEKRLPSMEVMKNLCHYKIYNSLMSNDFKEFILNNKKLEFNNPQKQKVSLDKIQKFLNRKMEIDSNSEITNKEKEKDKESQLNLKTETNISSENNNIKMINLKIKNKKIKLNKLTKNNTEEPNSSNFIKFINNHQTKTTHPLTTNNKHSYIISRDKEREKTKNNYTMLKNRRIMTQSNYTPSISIRPNSKKNIYKEKRIKSKSMLVSGMGDLENRKLDKFIFNNKYFKQFKYFEHLTNKELDFQKQLLELKNNNSKMYFKGFDTELQNNGKISRDEIYNSFLIIHDKVISKQRNYEKDIQNEIEKKNKPKIIGNVFKSVTNKMKEGKQIKNAMRKVLDRYVTAQKNTNINKNKNMTSIEEINKNNEYSIMKLNDNINEINYLLLSKSNESKNNNKKSYFL